MSRDTADGSAGLAWWRDCTCDPSCCAYGDCLLCVLLDPYYGLPCPRDREYGLAWPGGVAAGPAVLGRPLVVTLCGSMRFLPLMLRVAAQQTAGRGAVVARRVAHHHDPIGQVDLAAVQRVEARLDRRVLLGGGNDGERGQHHVARAGEIAYARGRGTPVELHRCPSRPAAPRDPVTPAVADIIDAAVVCELVVCELESVGLASAPAGQDVLEAEVVAPAPYRCPLDADPVTGEYPTVLRRAGVTGPGGVTAIGARAGDGRRAWWRTLATRRPAGSRVRWW